MSATVIPANATVLITGGAGFIGSAYVHLVVRTHPQWSIRVLDALTYCGFREHLAGLDDRVTFIEGDIACADAAHTAVAGCTAVVNFAAESHVDRSLVDASPFEHTNVQGVRVLLEACAAHNVARFLHVSTDEVYGDVFGTDRLSIESDPLAPVSPYAQSKAKAEALVQGATGIDTVITRGSNTYGPRQYPEKIVSLFVTSAIDDGALPVYGDGSALRDYMHVDDHCRGIDQVLHKGVADGIYNLGVRAQIDACTVAKSVVAAVGAGRIEHVVDRPDHDMRYAVDPASAEAIGWTPEIPFSEGLQQTVQWYRDNEAWWRAAKASADFRSFNW